jgi:hypothetical protein
MMLADGGSKKETTPIVKRIVETEPGPDGPVQRVGARESSPKTNGRSGRFIPIASQSNNLQLTARRVAGVRRRPIEPRGVTIGSILNPKLLKIATFY